MDSLFRARVGGELGRRVDDRAAVARRDRRRRSAPQRDRDRCDQPGGPHRSGDPRPGRLDVKIRLDRPGQTGAEEILGRHLGVDTLWNEAEASAAGGGGREPSWCRRPSPRSTSDRSGTRSRGPRLGRPEVLYAGDFASGPCSPTSGGAPGWQRSRARSPARRRPAGARARGGARGDRGRRGPPQHDQPRRLGTAVRTRGERIVFMRTSQGLRQGRTDDTGGSLTKRARGAGTH